MTLERSDSVFHVQRLIEFSFTSDTDDFRLIGKPCGPKSNGERDGLMTFLRFGFVVRPGNCVPKCDSFAQILHTRKILTIRISAYFVCHLAATSPEFALRGMNTLTPNDYDLLLECIRELHSFRSQSTLRSWLLDTALPKLVPSDWLSYNEVDLLQPENTLSILKPESTDFFTKLFPRFREVAHQHPLIMRQMQLVDFPVHKISDFLTQDAYHKLELYQDVYKVMGVEFQIAATIRIDPGHVTAFALSRQKNDYTERDRIILEMLRPHLVVAFNNLALINAHQAMLDTTKLALSELSSATIIIDSQDRILYHTGAGLQWIGATSPGILPAKISNWLKEHPAHGNHEILRLISNATEILIRIVPTDSPDRRLVILTQKNSTTSSAVTSKGFGLSKRQLEVAQWIGEGKTNAEIAAILGISPRTVQKHVEHIFEKMAVETRVAVATRLLD